MTEAVVDAIQCIAPEQHAEGGDADDVEIMDSTLAAPLDLQRIEIMDMEQKMGTDSRFVNGLVLDHGGRHPDMPKVLHNCHIMTCNVTFEYEKTEVQSGFFYSNAEEREQLEAAARTLDAVTAAATREFTDAAELVAAFLCESVPAPAGPSAEEAAASEEEEAPL